MTTMNSRAVFLRTTDNKEKKHTFDERRAWDVDLFMSSMQRQAREQGAKDKEPDRYTVSMMDRDEYRKATGKVAS